MNRRDRFALLGVILVTIRRHRAVAGASRGLGQAPAATLKTIQGETVALDDLRGQPVLVTFWATTCPGCLEGLPAASDRSARNLSRTRPDHLSRRRWSTTPPNQVIEFSHAANCPTTSPWTSTARWRRLSATYVLTPTTFLIAPDGRIVMNKIGQFDHDHVHAEIKRMLETSQAG
ncbi:MAG: TlpA disulfide reductase family protein [Gammaproteobacteria bacterium]|nr:TlpA disulfide reductase family protein [Gammaproteobacteria bacterium]